MVAQLKLIPILLALAQGPDSRHTPIARRCAVPPMDITLETGFIEPRKIRSVPPVYPASAQKAGKSGTVTLEVTVLETGTIWNPKVIKGITPDLDQAALDAVKQWEYAPLYRDGKPCWWPMVLKVTFVLPSPRAPSPSPSPRSQ